MQPLKKIMRTIILLLLFSVHNYAGAQVKNPYLDLKFDKVIFYDFEQSSEKGSLIIDNSGKPLQTIFKQIQLDPATAQSFNSKLGNKGSFGNVTAFCFDPHCGLVYFLKDKPVAQIAICLECNKLRSTIDLPAQQQGKQGHGQDVYYIADGLSKSFRKHINGMLKKYNFSHQIKSGSSFDE